jgi:hypothetical protein
MNSTVTGSTFRDSQQTRSASVSWNGSFEHDRHISKKSSQVLCALLPQKVRSAQKAFTPEFRSLAGKAYHAIY